MNVDSHIDGYPTPVLWAFAPGCLPAWQLYTVADRHAVRPIDYIPPAAR